MDKKRASTLNIINRFIAALGAKIDVKKVILYGSQLMERPDKWSDIDIAIISNDFEGMSAKERLLMLSKIAWDAKVTEIDAFGYTEAEFKRAGPLDLASEVKEHGVVVYEKP